jgi:hypothetical protein
MGIKTATMICKGFLFKLGIQNLFYGVNLLGLVFDEYCTFNNKNIKNKLHADFIIFVMAVCSSIDQSAPDDQFEKP